MWCRIFRVAVFVCLMQPLCGCMTFAVMSTIGWNPASKDFRFDPSFVEVPPKGPEEANVILLPYYDDRVVNPTLPRYMLASNQLDWRLAEQQFTTDDGHVMPYSYSRWTHEAGCPHRRVEAKVVDELPVLEWVKYADIADLMEPCQSGYAVLTTRAGGDQGRYRLAIFRVANGEIDGRTYAQAPALFVERHNGNIPLLAACWIALPFAVVGDLVLAPVEWLVLR